MLELDAQQEPDVSLVELAVGQWIYWMQFAYANSDTYQRVLVPLDRTEGAERVLSQADKLLRPEGEGILLHVIPAEGKRTAKYDLDLAEALEYLGGAVARLGRGDNRWRCDAIEAASVADGVIGYAERENVDIIVMNVHDRKGLARLTRRSVAREIKQRSPVDVRLFRSRELALR